MKAPKSPPKTSPTTSAAVGNFTPNIQAQNEAINDSISKPFSVESGDVSAIQLQNAYDIVELRRYSTDGNDAPATNAFMPPNSTESSPDKEPVLLPVKKSLATHALKPELFAYVCPECNEINQSKAVVCSGCGYDLKHTKPVPVHSFQSPRVSVLQQRKKPANDVCVERGAAAECNDLDATLQSQLTLNLRASTDSTLTNVTKSSSVDKKKKRHRHVTREQKAAAAGVAGASANSSISLEYSDNSYNVRKSVPRDLQQQLSINVKTSSDSSVQQLPG